jgi:uncharacterized caspase-like protein
MTEIAVVPRIRYPRDPRVGVSYLMTVDLDHRVPPEAWPYAEEEYPVMCFLDAGSLFEHEPVGDRTIVVHRFGGSYGPAVFRLRARSAARGTMRVILVDRVGLPIAVVPLEEIEVRTELPAVVPLAERIAGLPYAFRPAALEPPADPDHDELAPSRSHRGRALVVGAAMQALQGVAHDVRAMAEMLGRRGFEVDVCTGSEATRQGILGRYNALIESISPDEAAVFYYSGHAWHHFEKTESRSSQGISPIDFSESTDSDFRGITAWELAILEAQLTQRTRNVTVILDCSYASHLGRGGAVRDAEDITTVSDAVPRTLPHPVRQGFAAHLRALRARYGPAFEAVDPGGNRDVVRLVACTSDGAAYEYPGADGTFQGAFTRALLEILEEVGDAPASWALIGGLVREHVRRRFPSQRPDVEGPACRRVFSLVQEAPNDAVTLDRSGNDLRIDAGRLTGVMLGDVYGVVPLRALADRSSDVVAQLHVTAAFATTADVTLVRTKTGDPVIPPNAMAILIEKAVRRAIRIEVPDAFQQSVRAAILATKRLRIAEPDDPAPLATLRLTGDGLTIEDSLGPLFARPWPPAELRHSLENLANLAVAQELRELEGENGVHAAEIEVEWGAVDRGRMMPLPERGASLDMHDRIYVRVKSVARRRLYVHLLSLGVRGKITLLTSFAPSGVALTTEEREFVLGQRSDGTLLGLGVSSPSDLPSTSSPRTEELVVVVTSTPANLRSLETEEFVVARNVSAPERIDGFFVKRLCYSLRPQAAAAHGFATDVPPPPQEAEQTAVVDAVEDTAQAAPDDRARTEGDFGLVIGIEHYPHYRSLRGPVNDAMRFRDWLCQDIGGGVPTQNVMLILSSLETMTPSQTEIDEALVALLQAADARGGGRRLYFYFSGHGATSEGSNDDVALLLTRWSMRLSRLALSAAGYANMLSRTGLFGEVVMFIDCCRDLSTPVAAAAPTIAEMWTSPRLATRMFLAYATEAGRPAFEVRESDAWQGIFTRSLLSVLEHSNGISAHALQASLERTLDQEAGARGVFQRAHVTNELAADSRFGLGQMPFLELRFFQRRGLVTLRDGSLRVVAEHVADDTPWRLRLPDGLYLLEGGGQPPLAIQHDGRGPVKA